MASISEIKRWLSDPLYRQGIKEFSVDILGNTEKGDGYLGDIIFVNVKGIGNTEEKELNLVLKCGKKSLTLREKVPVKESYLQELYMYDTVIPAFTQFQLERGATDYFDSVAQYYGKYVNEDTEVLILENLKKKGYDLWDRRKPLTTDHLHLILKKYGKWHATSIAMQDQRPERFAELSGGVTDVFKKMFDTSNLIQMLQRTIDESCDILKGLVDEDVLIKWKNCKSQVRYIFYDIFDFEGVKVITHGDSWNNNFLFYSEYEDQTKPSKVAFLDWQISKYCTPVRDLSYFLFATISEDDINNLDGLLEYYYKSLSIHLKLLGSDPEKLYPLQQLFDDWKKFSRFGLLLGITVAKVALTEKEEVTDIVDVVENGSDFSDAFNYEVKDKKKYAYRIKHLLEHAAQNNLI